MPLIMGGMAMFEAVHISQPRPRVLAANRRLRPGRDDHVSRLLGLNIS